MDDSSDFSSTTSHFQSESDTIDDSNSFSFFLERSFVAGLKQDFEAVMGILDDNQRRIATLITSSVLPPSRQPSQEEPEQGLLVAIRAPSFPRYSRRFSPDATGEAVYAWVISWPEVKAVNLKDGDFDLFETIGAVLQRNETLVNQHILHRTVLELRMRGT
jgi:hypothetical protein